MQMILILFASLLISTHVLADESTVQKYRNYTPQQIMALSEAIRKSDVPMMYLMAARSGLSAGSDLYFGMQLNSLMYSGVHDYKAAVRAYQSDLGDKPTGVLTVWQIHNLEQRSGMQKLSRVIFPSEYSSRKTDDYAMIQGTFIIIDDQIAWPINHVRVKCYKNENHCQLNQIQLDIPDDKSWSQKYTLLEQSTEYYAISRWEQDSIDANAQEFTGDCRTSAMNFNFKTKEFYQITRNAGGDCETPFGSVPKLPKPRISQIVDGRNIINETFDKIEKAAYDALASDFRRKAEALDAKEKKK